MVQEKDVFISNTKREILDAYNELKKRLEEKSKLELKPEKRIEEKKVNEVIQVADSLPSEGVVKGIDNLKMDVSKMLSELSEKLENAVNKYNDIKKAIEVKEKEFNEIYDIDKSAYSLAALIEAQRQKREEFEHEIETRKRELTEEINNTRMQWEKEKTAYLEEKRDLDAEEKKKRSREQEEYKYSLEREKEIVKNRFEDEKTKLQKELSLKSEEFEKTFKKKEEEIEEREKLVFEREQEIEKLKKQVESFPKELDAIVNKAIKETTEKIQGEAKNRELLLKKEADGERNVLLGKIEALEKNVTEQNSQIEKLSAQQEKSYQKVQEIAMKSIEGTGNTRILGKIEQLIAEKSKKQTID